MEDESGGELETWDPMSPNTNGTSSPNKNKVKGEVMGSKPNRCIWNLPIQGERDHVLEEDMNFCICLKDPKYS